MFRPTRIVFRMIVGSSRFPHWMHQIPGMLLSSCCWGTYEETVFLSFSHTDSSKIVSNSTDTAC
jgi:hypothetical protein